MNEIFSVNNKNELDFNSIDIYIKRYKGVEE